MDVWNFVESTYRYRYRYIEREIERKEEKGGGGGLAKLVYKSKKCELVSE